MKEAKIIQLDFDGNPTAKAVSLESLKWDQTRKISTEEMPIVTLNDRGYPKIELVDLDLYEKMQKEGKTCFCLHCNSPVSLFAEGRGGEVPQLEFEHIKIEDRESCPMAALEYISTERPLDKTVCGSLRGATPQDLHRERKKRAEFIFNKIGFNPSKENVEKNKEAMKDNKAKINETIGFLWHELTGRWPNENDQKEIATYKALAFASDGIPQWGLPFAAALFADSQLRRRSNNPGYFRNSFEWENKSDPQDGEQQFTIKDTNGAEKHRYLPKFLHRFFRNHRPTEKTMNGDGGDGSPIKFDVSESFFERIYLITRGMHPQSGRFERGASGAPHCL